MAPVIQYDPAIIMRTHPSLDVLLLNSVDSTNTYAKMLAAERNALIIAREQTAGYGRFKRVWRSGKDSDVMMSLLLVRPASAPGAMVSLYAGYQLLKAIEGYVDAPLAIKYPNDLYIAGKKCAGILVEHIYRGAQLERTVIGIGINVYGDAASLRADGLAAASLAEYGFYDDVSSMLNSFLTAFFSEQSLLGRDASLFVERFARYHFLYDKRVHAAADGEDFDCTVKGITLHGGIILERNGIGKEYHDVSIGAMR